MSAAALDFSPATTPFFTRIPSEISGPPACSLVLAAGGQDGSGGCGVTFYVRFNQSITVTNQSRAIKSYIYIRTSLLDFWFFHWSELFTHMAPPPLVCITESSLGPGPQA